MAATTFILRPSSDISIGHTLFPAESATAYLLINEETSDEDATYISVKSEKDQADSTTTVTSSFRLSGTVPNDEVMVTEVLISCSCKYTGGSASNNGLLSVAGAALTTPINLSGGGTLSYSTTTVSAGEEVINAINNYIIANGSFPEITISIESSATGKDSEGYKSSAYGVAYISQLYLTVTYHTGIYRKIADVWKPSYQIYQKVNDAWTQITTSSAKSIMKSRLLKAGHEKIAIQGYAATCLEDGLTTGYKCSICGHVFTPQEVIPALGHSPYTIAGKAPTCGATGLTDWQQCSRCGVTLVPQEVIPATGNHEFITNNLHTVCGTCGQIKDRGFVSLSQYGTATDLSVARYYLTGTSVGGYALFAGGAYIGNSYNTVDAYNASLTRSIPTALSISREQLAATTIGGYALFAGGDTGASIDSSCVTVDAYNTSLTRTNVTALSQARSELAGTSVGGYALFAGGITDGASGSSCVTVDAYNTSLTRSIPTALSQSRCGLAATTVGNFALFGGGLTSSSGGAADRKNHVDAYDASLTRTNPSGLSIYGLTAAATAGFYAVFAGGYDSTSVGGYTSSTVNAYNRSLTRTSPTSLSHHRDRIAATSVANYAIFGGGRHSGGFGDIDNSSAVDVYNHSLTRSNPGSLSEARMNLAAAVVGDYALFAGGDDKTSRVDVYKIS